MGVICEVKLEAWIIKGPVCGVLRSLAFILRQWRVISRVLDWESDSVMMHLYFSWL